MANTGRFAMAAAILLRNDSCPANHDQLIPPEFYKLVAEIIHIPYAKTPRKASAK
jgi:hypothetical protein